VFSAILAVRMAFLNTLNGIFLLCQPEQFQYFHSLRSDNSRD